MSVDPKPRGFQISCPHCGSVDGLILEVTTLAMSCRECDSDCTPADLQAAAAEIDRFLKWLDAAGGAA